MDNPLTTNPPSFAVTYTSSNEAVATVDANTGAVTLDAAGTTTITAEYGGGTYYNAAANASYTLTVVDDESVSFEKNEVVFAVNTNKAYTAATGDDGKVTYTALEGNVNAATSSASNAITYTSSDENLIKVNAETGEDSAPYVIGAGNQAFWGYVVFEMEAGKTYHMFGDKWQVGFNGWEFTPAPAAGPEIPANAIYFWESPDGTPVEKGGKIEYMNGDGERLNYSNAGYHTICLNGKTTAPGKLTSAKLTGGIKSLSFKYGFPFGTQKFAKRAPEHTQQLWDAAEITPDASLKDTLGLDSLDLVDVVVLVDQHFGVTLSAPDFIGVVTFENFYDLLDRKINE